MTTVFLTHDPEALETADQVHDVLSGKMPYNALNLEHARRLACFRVTNMNMGNCRTGFGSIN